MLFRSPGSKMDKRNLLENLMDVRDSDEFKFVILDRNDFDWAVKRIVEADLNPKQVLFSPVHGSLNPLDLIEWMKNERLNTRFQLQLHKVLWGSETEGV